MKLSGDRCQCTACGEYFNSTGMFDRHRVDKYPNRRCLTTDEMSLKGYTTNRAGFWIRSIRGESQIFLTALAQETQEPIS